ncbi:hypothetical protein F2P79_010023 [Pimephales promelas]|nr:hypothetical protein F2P79_010023 [Pimephales promelas]
MHYKASVWHQTDCVITAQGEKRRATERTRAVPVPSPRPPAPTRKSSRLVYSKYEKKKRLTTRPPQFRR